jgi:imidazolonepropionase-like amidohydrolase
MSNDPESSMDEHVFSDQQARRLLERAIQLDAKRAGDTTLAELKRVAQELNISSAAFADALRELEGKAVAPATPVAPLAVKPEPGPAVSERANWWRPLGIGIASFFGAAMAGRNEEAALMVAFAATVALILHHRHRKTPGQFQLELLALWGPFSLGWLAAAGPRGMSEVYALIVAWLASSTIGGFIVRFKWPWRKPDPPTNPATIASLLLLTAVPAMTAAQTSMHAGTLIDGRGNVQRDVVITTRDGRIDRISPRSTIRDPRSITHDLSQLTVLPGLIDTHVHIISHFGKDGRASNEGETASERMLYTAENAYVTLMAGFTTVQSIGAAPDLELRAAIERGILPGPRLLTSIQSLNDETASPQQLRDYVKDMNARGADLIKFFASKSIREGGAQTISSESIKAGCDAANAAGKRSWIHAHAASAVRAAAESGCFAVTHGSMVTDAELALMAQRGTFFEPNIGLVSQNYIENKPKYLGIGNYDEAGFRFMEEGIPRKLDMFKRALRTPGLKIIMGTDATAGAHGQNAREIVYRVKTGGQKPMDAIIAATSLNAEALGMKDRIGAIATGMEADLIAVDGNPLEDISALQRVVFVMKGGKVYKFAPKAKWP